MPQRTFPASLIAGCLLVLGVAPAARAQAGGATSPAPQRESTVSNHASGTFEVKMAPQAPTPNVGDPTVGRMSLEKQFHGDLEGSSRGEMLAVQSGVEGSAGYVAMERFTGSLRGRTGSFAMQHHGVMNRGAPSLTITVVPDSGTGQLVGLAGTMTIDIADGKHLYGFDYTLPAP
jgi:hypothetical protein